MCAVKSQLRSMSIFKYNNMVCIIQVHSNQQAFPRPSVAPHHVQAHVQAKSTASTHTTPAKSEENAITLCVALCGAPLFANNTERQGWRCGRARRPRRDGRRSAVARRSPAANAPRAAVRCALRPPRRARISTSSASSSSGSSGSGRRRYRSSGERSTGGSTRSPTK